MPSGRDGNERHKSAKKTAEHIKHVTIPKYQKLRFLSILFSYICTVQWFCRQIYHWSKQKSLLWFLLVHSQSGSFFFNLIMEETSGFIPTSKESDQNYYRTQIFKTKQSHTPKLSCFMFELTTISKKKEVWIAMAINAGSLDRCTEWPSHLMT